MPPVTKQQVEEVFLRARAALGPDAAMAALVDETTGLTPLFNQNTGGGGSSTPSWTSLVDVPKPIDTLADLAIEGTLYLGADGTVVSYPTTAFAKQIAAATDANAALTVLGAEKALGNPVSDGRVLSSTAAGVRSWVMANGHSHAIADVTLLQSTLDDKLSISASRAANTVYAAPNGSAGAPSFRLLASADIPNLDTAKLTSGTLGYARGGTGISAPGATPGNLRWNGSAYTIDTASYALASAIPAASSTTPAALGTAAVGTGTTWARADHVHAMPTAAQVGAEPALGNPSVSGYVLSSTTAGVRSWVAQPTIPVASVFGRTGSVIAASGDYSAYYLGISATAAAATKLATGRTIGITGDATWTSPSFDGSANVSAALTLASVITAGGPTGSSSVVPVITYDAKGRLTAVTTATITPAAIGAQSLNSNLTALSTGQTNALTIANGVASTNYFSNTSSGDTVFRWGSPYTEAVHLGVMSDSSGSNKSAIRFGAGSVGFGYDATFDATISTPYGKLRGHYSDATYQGFYPSGVTPNNNNFAILWHSSNAQTYLNATSGVYLQIFDGTTRNDRLIVKNTSIDIYANTYIYSRTLSVGSTGNAAAIEFKRGSDGSSASFIGHGSATGSDSEFRYQVGGGSAYHSWYTNNGTNTAERMRLSAAGVLSISSGGNISTAKDVTPTTSANTNYAQASLVAGRVASSGTATTAGIGFINYGVNGAFFYYDPATSEFRYNRDIASPLIRIWDSANLTPAAIGAAASTDLHSHPSHVMDLKNATTHGSIKIGSSNIGAWQGIEFSDSDLTRLLISGGSGSDLGFYNNSGWIWKVSRGGALITGTVPWGNLTGIPSLVTGVGSTGFVSIWNSSSSISYSTSFAFSGRALTIGDTGNAGLLQFKRNDGAVAASIGYTASATESQELRFSSYGGGAYFRWDTNAGEKMRLVEDGTLTLQGNHRIRMPNSTSSLVTALAIGESRSSNVSTGNGVSFDFKLDVAETVKGRISALINTSVSRESDLVFSTYGVSELQESFRLRGSDKSAWFCGVVAPGYSVSYDLGTAGNRWRHVYVGGFQIGSTFQLTGNNTSVLALAQGTTILPTPVVGNVLFLFANEGPNGTLAITAPDGYNIQYRSSGTTTTTVAGGTSLAFNSACGIAIGCAVYNANPVWRLIW